MDIPTGVVFVPPGEGVCVSTVATMTMQIAMPIPPTMNTAHC
jgi:hypothetical protein